MRALLIALAVLIPSVASAQQPDTLQIEGSQAVEVRKTTSNIPSLIITAKPDTVTLPPDTVIQVDTLTLPPDTVQLPPDTVIQVDTLTVTDTLVVTDTVVEVRWDTVVVVDTVVIHDTVTVIVGGDTTVIVPDEDVISFILGPQAPVGTHPWPEFDSIAEEHAEEWATAYLEEAKGGTDYYDLALVLYQIHARTGDPKWRELALDVAQFAWNDMPDKTDWTATPDPFAQAPRTMPFAGLTLLALSERDVGPQTFTNPNDTTWSETYELWDWLVGYSRKMNKGLLSRWIDSNDGLHSGIRDGGMLVRYLAILSQAHPDEAVRQEMLDYVVPAARDYYADEQLPDGSWRWNTREFTQPFQVGLLLEGLIAVHQITGDTAIFRAIVNGTEALWRDQIDRNDIPFGLLPEQSSVMGAYYFVYNEGCEPPIPASQPGCGNEFTSDMTNWTATNKLRVIRHRNTLVVHPFGYLYFVTGDSKWRDRGDELFVATYADPNVPLLTDKGKEYIQIFRSTGRYLAWRALR